MILELLSVKFWIIALYAVNVGLFPPSEVKCVMVVDNKCAMYEVNPDGWNTNAEGEVN
jgi:hypothetical protein